MPWHRVTASAAKGGASAATLLLAASLLIPGCGGSKAPMLADEASSTNGSSFSEQSYPGDDYSAQENVIPVKMRPAPQQLPPFSIGGSGKGASSALPIGSPRELERSNNKQESGGARGVSYDPSELDRQGSSFDLILPYNNVEPDIVDPGTAVFSPQLPAVQLADAAYALYDFPLEGYSETDHEQTLGLDFAVDPSDPGNVWVGLGNQDSNQWDWFKGEDDGVISFGSFAPYEAGDGSVLVALVMLGDEQLKLKSLRIGEFEMRATGDMALPPDTPFSPHQDFPILSPGLFTVDLSADCAPIGDQGGIGSCTGWATASGALNYDLGQLYEDWCWDLTDDTYAVSPRFVYNQTGVDLGGSCPSGGRTTMDVSNWLVANGASTEANAPYGSTSAALYDCDNDWSAAALADADLLHPSATTFIGSIHPVSGNYHLDDDDINTARNVLRTMRKPLIFRTQVDNGFSAVDYAGGGSWTYSGPNLGGHAMLIVGYDDDRNGGSFKIRNSWGTDWGDDGYGWMTYAMCKGGTAGVYAQYLTTDFDPAVLDRFCPGPKFKLPPYRLFIPLWRPDIIRFEWTAPPNVQRYVIFRDNLEQPIGSAKGNETSFEDDSVEDGYAHVYWVQAIDEQGQASALSAPIVGWLEDSAPELK